MKMSTQVDLFTDVEPTSVSPAIAKPIVSRSCGQKKYSVIYADPAWNYNSRMALGKGALKSSAEDYYNVMSTQEIMDLPVSDISAKDCILFIWVTMPKLNEVFKVIDAWGFEYKTCAFVWVKRNKIFCKERNKNRGGIDDFMGQGRWVRQNSELCLLATKGNPKRISAKVRQVVYQPIQEHSKKPNEVREKIVELVGDLPRLEMFARQANDGWDVWGNQVSKSIELNAGNNYG